MAITCICNISRDPQDVLYMYPPGHPLAGQLHHSSGQQLHSSQGPPLHTSVGQQLVGPHGQVMNVAPQQMGGMYPGGAMMGPQYLVQQYPGAHYQVSFSSSPD